MSEVKQRGAVGEVDSGGVIASAKRVLALESEAIDNLAAGLDGSFVRAVDLLGNVAGRVIVTGMGKSGHVARKIAATLASTGTPALFVHPGEASHGDLGMVARKDAVIALSNSGKTAELNDIVAYTRRFQIPLIAMTARPDSQLAERADICLQLAAAPEACPLGLAPTTSTTMMLALGDALAVALLEQRGFSEEDFQVFHPGGALGARLLRVSDLMHAADRLPLCREDTPMSEAILIMSNKQFGCIGVVNAEGCLVGIITDGDLRRHLGPDVLVMTAKNLMTPSPKTVASRALAVEALQLMDEHRITILFVVEDGRPSGLIQLYDCLRAGVA
ncbi:MAG: KpsF/GutQ family sugar-phosphate isomerase [Kiloniellales bacterium]